VCRSRCGTKRIVSDPVTSSPSPRPAQGSRTPSTVPCTSSAAGSTPAHNNWPDLRAHAGGGDETPPFPELWCHRSAGIRLARLAIRRHRPHPLLAAEAAAALQSTCAAAIDAFATGDLSEGLTLCHGLGGAIELLVEAYREHLMTACWLADRALEPLGDDVAAQSGGVRGLPGPGLMNGLTGTLCVLAEIEHPEAVPCLGLLDVTTPVRQAPGPPLSPRGSG